MITPSVACCAGKYFWLNLTTTSTSASDTGRISRAISVILGLMVSIMMSTPIMVVTLVISWVMLWFRLLAQRVHIVGDAGKYLADGALFKVGQGQAVDLFADLAAEVIADLLRKPVMSQP